MGTLEVVIPPDFVPEETSGDMMIPEGGTIRLGCRARGSPEPKVVWRREDGQDIILREPVGAKSKGETNQFAKVCANTSKTLSQCRPTRGRSLN
jgi:neurotrimin